MQDNILYADGFDKALIGTEKSHGQPTIAVYDRDKCINILAEDMPYEEAVEYFEFNVAGAFVGEQTPIFVDLEEKYLCL
jgi:hypothetical protein